MKTKRKLKGGSRIKHNTKKQNDNRNAMEARREARKKNNNNKNNNVPKFSRTIIDSLREHINKLIIEIEDKIDAWDVTYTIAGIDKIPTTIPVFAPGQSTPVSSITSKRWKTALKEANLDIDERKRLVDLRSFLSHLIDLDPAFRRDPLLERINL